MGHPPRSERPSMADYGVPSEPEGTLPWSWAEQRLSTCRNYWVVTASIAARPHAMPVWGVWMTEPGRFWFSCSPNARKARNLAANPQISIAVSDTVEVVVVEGRATSHADGADRRRMIEAFAQKYAEPGKHDEMIGFIDAHAVWEVTPERAFAIIENEEDFASKATRWVW